MCKKTIYLFLHAVIFDKHFYADCDTNACNGLPQSGVVQVPFSTPPTRTVVECATYCAQAREFCKSFTHNSLCQRVSDSSGSKKVHFNFEKVHFKKLSFSTTKVHFYQKNSFYLKSSFKKTVFFKNRLIF
jgi:hypothetical protein